MRIVARLFVRERRDHDLAAAGRLVGGKQLLHPWIIIDAVDNDDLGGGEGLGGRGARFEKMRILVRIREDAGHRDIRPADLGRDVAVEILRGHDLDRIGSRGGARPERQGKNGDQG